MSNAVYTNYFTTFLQTTDVTNSYSSNMGSSLTSFTYNNYLENTKAKSAVCKNVVK